MLKNNYTCKLLEKENQRLHRENEQLRKRTQETEHLKKEYRTLITNLRECKDKYTAALGSIHALEAEMHREMDAFTKKAAN